MTTIVASFYGPGPAVPRQAAGPSLPAATTFSRRLARLRSMLIRDEQTRRPPPITLPRLRGRPAHGSAGPRGGPRSRPRSIWPRSIPRTRRLRSPWSWRPSPGIPECLRRISPVIGRAAGVRSRPTVVVYLARLAGRLAFSAIAASLGMSKASAWGAHARIAHQRTVDPALAHDLADIELDLGMSREVA